MVFPTPLSLVAQVILCEVPDLSFNVTVALVPALLQTKLNSIGINPLVETNIATKQLEINKSLISQELDPIEEPLELLEAIYTHDEVEAMFKDGITIPEFKLFGEAVKSKVFGYKYFDENEKHIFKEIDAHKELKTLSFYERKEIRKLSKKQQNSSVSAYRKIFESEKITKKNGIQKTNLTAEEIEKVQSIAAEVTEINEVTLKIQDEIIALCLEKSGLVIDKNTSKWVKDLTVAKMIAMANNEYTSPLEKN